MIGVRIRKINLQKWHFEIMEISTSVHQIFIQQFIHLSTHQSAI